MKWIDVKEQKPRTCDSIIFTDGVEVYFGWLETLEDGEDPLFYNMENNEGSKWPEGVIYWMEKPEPPVAGDETGKNRKAEIVKILNKEGKILDEPK